MTFMPSKKPGLWTRSWCRPDADMIRYDLNCANEHSFDGWFRDSAGFEAQNADGTLLCPHCGSNEIEKALMTPGLPVKSNAARGMIPREAVSEASPSSGGGLTPDDPKLTAFRQAMRAFRSQVEANADYVGDRFAEEARAIYYAETDKTGTEATADEDASPKTRKRGIYGEATLEDAKALLEEGIDVLPLPVLPEDQN